MIELALALALQDAAPKSAGGAYFECVRVTAARLAESKETADVVAEGAIYGCRDLLRAAAIEQLPPATPPRRGIAPPPSGAVVIESEDRVRQEARGAAILLILEDKVRKK